MTVLNLLGKFFGIMRVVIFGSNSDLLFDGVVSSNFALSRIPNNFNSNSVGNWDVICTGRDDWIKLTVYLED